MVCRLPAAAPAARQYGASGTRGGMAGGGAALLAVPPLFADRAPSAATYSPIQILTAVLPHSWPFQTASCLLLFLLLRHFPLPQRKNVDNVKKV
jgi:hypothetical protein